MAAVETTEHTPVLQTVLTKPLQADKTTVTTAVARVRAVRTQPKNKNSLTCSRNLQGKRAALLQPKKNGAKSWGVIQDPCSVTVKKTHGFEGSIMRGSVVYQVHEVFKEIIRFGESKHEAKELAREQGAKTWHEISKNIGIYSYKTADQYRDISKEAFRYAKEQFNVKDIEKLQGEHIRAYLESKIADGIKYSTFQKYSAALEKLEIALNKYAETHDTGKEYHFDLSSVREQAREVLERTQVTRAYENPQALINSIQNPEYHVIAQAQYEGGFRISELNHLSEKNFKENNTFQVISGKGGKDREVPLSKETYQALQSLLDKADKSDGKYKFNMDAYRNALKEAAQTSNQEYTGSHGLRWNFAQEKFMELQRDHGKTYEQALQIVSNLLGHERADITEHYLR